MYQSNSELHVRNQIIRALFYVAHALTYFGEKKGNSSCSSTTSIIYSGNSEPVHMTYTVIRYIIHESSYPDPTSYIKPFFRGGLHHSDTISKVWVDTSYIQTEWLNPGKVNVRVLHFYNKRTNGGENTYEKQIMIMSSLSNPLFKKVCIQINLLSCSE